MEEKFKTIKQLEQKIIEDIRNDVDQCIIQDLLNANIGRKYFDVRDEVD